MRNFNLTSSCQICHQQDFFLGHHVYYLEYEEFSLDDLAKICPQHDVFRICPLVDVYNISYYILYINLVVDVDSTCLITSHSGEVEPASSTSSNLGSPE